jgi:hypothetical protein
VARIIFFDLETRLWASDLDPENEQHGWDLLREGKGGASAIALYDTKTEWVHCYDDLSILTCAKHLESADLVVGFRSEAFDIPVIEGLIGRKLALKGRYDIYEEMAQQNAVRGIVGGRGDFTLDSVSKRNLGRGKVNHGSNAKMLAQRGRFGELFSYCLSDVELTRALFTRICRDGGLINLGGGFLTLPVPDYVTRALAS